MKKSYLMIAAAAALFAACSSNDTFKEVNEDVAIGFNSPYVSKPTKAEITDSWKTTDGSAFGVFGYKNGFSGTLLFNNEKVTYNSSTSWTHPTVRYWDKSATAATAYSFYAYAPYASSDTVSISNGLITFNLGAQVFRDADQVWSANPSTLSTIDLCIAQAVEGIGYANSTYTNPDGTVLLTFNHVLSKLSFKIKKYQDLAYDVQLNSLSVGFPTGTGVTWAQLTKPAAATATGSITYATYTPATANTYSTPIVSDKTQDVDFDADLIADAASFIVSPVGNVTGSAAITQHDINVQVGYTIDYDTNANDNIHNFDSQVATGVAHIEFAAGNHYYLTIIINPETIEFDVTDVVPFTTVDADEVEVK